MPTPASSSRACAPSPRRGRASRASRRSGPSGRGGANNLLHGLAAQPETLDEARALHRDLWQVAEARAGEAGVEAIWTEWAKGAYNLLYGLKAEPETLDEARRLHRDLFAVAEARAGEPGVEAIWTEWAAGAFNLLNGLRQAPETLDEAGALHRDLRTVAEARAGEPGVEAIWTEWAKGAFNLAITFEARRDVVAMRALLRAIAEVAPGRIEGEGTMEVEMIDAFVRCLRGTLFLIAASEGEAAVRAFADRAVTSGAVPPAIVGAVAFQIWTRQGNGEAMDAQVKIWQREQPALVHEVARVAMMVAKAREIDAGGGGR